jgi:hypothetical protein
MSPTAARPGRGGGRREQGERRPVPADQHPHPVPGGVGREHVRPAVAGHVLDHRCRRVGRVRFERHRGLERAVPAAEGDFERRAVRHREVRLPVAVEVGRRDRRPVRGGRGGGVRERRDRTGERAVRLPPADDHGRRPVRRPVPGDEVGPLVAVQIDQRDGDQVGRCRHRADPDRTGRRGPVEGDPPAGLADRQRRPALVRVADGHRGGRPAERQGVAERAGPLPRQDHHRPGGRPV